EDRMCSMDTVFNCVIPYIQNGDDRNSVSLVCHKWNEIDGFTQERRKWLRVLALRKTGIEKFSYMYGGSTDTPFGQEDVAFLVEKCRESLVSLRVDSCYIGDAAHAINNRKDKTAITFLYQALPEDQLLQITKHKTAKAIWDSLKTRHIREERVQQARLQTLKSDFEMLHMKEDETIDTFTTKLTTLVNKAASLGHTMKDETLVRKLLNDVPDRYLQIIVSIEQYSDVSEMTLEEAIGHIAPKCPQKTKPNEQSNLVEEDLKSTLLMAILEDEEEQKVLLYEENVGYKETNKDSLWYLDNEAINHVTEIRENFKELDEKVSGKVRFEDGSYIEIKGKGSILIGCDDEKQRIISHVYYIPDLKGNLLSLGQFTEISCKVVMEDDELRLYDMDNKIFMKVT
nr:zinc finger, CCHC-type [Tanacetum cinerariifolium]